MIPPKTSNFSMSVNTVKCCHFPEKSSMEPTNRFETETLGATFCIKRH